MGDPALALDPTLSDHALPKAYWRLQTALGDFLADYAGWFSVDFWRALSTLPFRGVTRAHMDVALLFAAQFARRRSREPHIDLVEGGVQFGWNAGSHVLTIAVFEDGSTDWFSLDRETGRAEGTDEGHDREAPAAFWAALEALR